MAMQSNWRLASVVLVVTAGAIEAIGARLASVSVKRERIPIVVGGDEEDEKDGRRPVATLSLVNTSLTDIDLLAVIIGPVLTVWWRQWWRIWWWEWRERQRPDLRRPTRIHGNRHDERHIIRARIVSPQPWCCGNWPTSLRNKFG